MVYQAVSDYWANAEEPEYDMSVDILLPGRSLSDKFKFSRDNQFITRTSKVKHRNSLTPFLSSS